MSFQDKGIYAINGPNWERDLKTICDSYPETLCDYYKSISGET